MKPNGIEPHLRKDLFGGRGEVRVWNLMGNRAMPPFAAVLACELAPGGKVGSHLQQSADEIVVITEGEGTAHVDGEPQALMPGTVVWLPLGKHLKLENGSQAAPLRYLIVKALPGTPANP
jgi:mannose-6-phosphate isomerase-like protein (cupin superfamily)